MGVAMERQLMTLQEILEAIDHLTFEEMEQVRTRIVERESYLASEPESDDLESMLGLFQSTVTGASVHARQYLRDIFQNKPARSS
jgi:hypothetical protein